MEETIPIEIILGTNCGFQSKILLHSLLERFGSNFEMIELALILAATIALILFAGIFLESILSPSAPFAHYKYGVSTKRPSRNLPEGIKARKMQFILALFAIINQANNGFSSTAKPIHHRKLIVDYLSGFDSFKINAGLKLSISDKNMSEPSKFTASESATIGSNPSNMTDQASNAAVTRALDPAKHLAIVQALNAPFVKRSSTIELTNTTPFVDKIMACNSTGELIFGGTNNPSNKLLPGWSRPLVRQRRNVAVPNSIGFLLPEIYPTSSSALMENQAGAQMENMALVSNAKVKVTSKVEAKRRSIETITGQRKEQLAQFKRQSVDAIFGQQLEGQQAHTQFKRRSINAIFGQHLEGNPADNNAIQPPIRREPSRQNIFQSAPNYDTGSARQTFRSLFAGENHANNQRSRVLSPSSTNHGKRSRVP